MRLLKKYLFATFFCAGAFLPFNQAFSAPQEGWFAGGGFASTISNSKSEVTASSALISFSDSQTRSDQGFSWGLQGGYTYPNLRFYGNFSTDTIKNGEASTLLILADWLHESGFFIGGGGGNVSVEIIKDEANSQFSFKGLKGSSFGLALQGGGIFHFQDNLSFQGGYRYIDTNVKMSKTGPLAFDSATTINAKATIAIESLQSWFAGVNYHF